jgi:2-polyprenyl-6-methoxyphenol hydroxylase-like FAD-dependent oxidoreductase
METKRTAVVIIGAGPTGLSLAAQLLRYNVDFIIIEKNDKTTLLSKAVVVQARTLEIFDELGIAEEAMKRGRVTTALNLFYKGKRRTHVDLAGLGEGISKYSFALSLEQSKTEELLAEYVLAYGKAIEWSSHFSHCEQSDDKVIVHYSDAAGKPQSIEAQYAVGCDGASSVVRHQLGLQFEGDTIPKLFYVADVTLSSSVIHGNELCMFLIKKGFILFFPMQGDGHYRIIGVLPDVKDPDAKIEFSDIKEDILNQVNVPLSITELRWFSSYRVHTRMADKFMKGRCFIAGDAGHIHTPAGGQGMNTGIQDAYNLAWKLGSVINNNTNKKLLETYDTERRANAKHLLKSTDRIFDIMAGITVIGNFIRLRIFPFFAGMITGSAFARKRFFPLLSQTSIAYPDSPLSIRSAVGKVKAGDRMPYFVLADGSNSYDYIKKPEFKVLCFGNITTSGLSPRIQMIHFHEVPKSFGHANDFYIVLRPDNHIAYIGNDILQCEKLPFSLWNTIAGLW